MSWSPCPDPVPGDRASAEAVEMLIVPRAVDLGEMQVRRALPSVKRQMVGPFIFFDQMGPAEFLTDQGINVRPIRTSILQLSPTCSTARSFTGTVWAPRRRLSRVPSTGCGLGEESSIPNARARSAGVRDSDCSASRPGWRCRMTKKRATQPSFTTAPTNSRR